MMNDKNNFNNKNTHNVKNKPKTGRLAFKKVYQNKIAPLLNKYEQERKSTLSFCVIVCGILLILGIFIIVLEIKAGAPKSATGGLLIICLAQLIWKSKKYSFEYKIKKEIMPAVCECIGNIRWEPFGSLSNVYHEDCDDYFYGSYKDINIEVIGHAYPAYYSIFNDVIVVLDLNKSFTGHTLIQERGLSSFLDLGKRITGQTITIIDRGQSSSQLCKLPRTSYEDPEFNKKYEVFTDDEVEARYLLTPSFMERLKNIKNVFKAKYVSCSFYQGKLYIALHTGKDLFALGSLIKSVNDPEPYYQMFDEIYSIMKLVNHFKLNEKTGL